MSKLFGYLKPFRRGIGLVLLLLLAQALAELFLPTLMSDIVNGGVVRAIVEGQPRTPYILRIGGLMLAITLFSGGASMYSTFLSQRIASGAARDLRRDLFSRVESFSQNEFDRFSSASLITRCTGDVSQVQSLANVSARMLVYAPILGIGGIAMALSRSVSMAWTIALAVLVLMGVTVTVVIIVMPKFKAIQKLIDSLNRVSREVLHGLMVIRAFRTEAHERDRFDKVNRELKNTTLFVMRVNALIGPAITLVQAGTQVLVIWVGAHHVASSGMPIGDIIAFMQYAMQVIFSFFMVSMVLIMVPRAGASAARIGEVLATTTSITDPERPADFAKSTAGSTVSFRNVGFRYPGAEADAVADISFDALPGQTTAIIGATGSGKSTIAALLLRFYDVSSGSILIGGTNIRQVRQADLRAKIGYVPQKSRLLSGSIASNIRYGRPEATEAELRKAAEVAQALEFVEGKEGGFEAEISQGGGNVSGGERQRLSIARALAKNPEILVFDDSFSALDFRTDAKLREELKRHTGDAAVIVIAQRVGTIMGASQILVLEEGRIIGRGTHGELLESCPAYREIAVSQGVLGNQGVPGNISMEETPAVGGSGGGSGEVGNGR
ncbi:MAG: ABC transporter ATP-binding protein/permease [Treponema sp.]|nr:ABC transporter ATP-binding protein/permease [Treponema sp.]